MAWWAGGWFTGWLVAVFGVRAIVAFRRSGDTGMRGISSPAGSSGWWGGVLFVVAIAAGGAGIVAHGFATGTVDRLETTSAAMVGWLLVTVGSLATVAVQLDMGHEWRVGVDPDEETDLVTTGTFAWVRNPVFSAMLVTAFGFVLVVPNLITIAAALTLVVAVELQVRVVEEPYLIGQHGAEYRAYAARVGRFVPAVGRLRERRVTLR